MTSTTAPRNLTSTLVSVETSWERLARNAPSDHFPFLDGIPLIELHTRFRQPRVSETWKTRVLNGLLAAAAAGDDLAQHTLVRLYIPKALRFARSCAALRGLSIDDATQVAISAFWEASLTYPTERTKNPGANYTLNALHIINAGSPDSPHEVAVDDVFLEWRANHEPEPTPSPDRDLAEVLAWALESRVLERTEIQLMTRYYLADCNTTERELLALELKLSPTALQKRASRIRLRLIDAVRAHIHTHGSW